METFQLEAMVKELELKTIKAHINPHFIFNSLNGIRALVDENPLRAREAITQLSNILRSSLQAEKSETESLDKELKIVVDYLALESMRFEDRLRVVYDIEPQTLNRQVPPMMLQNLVENALKHGISKQITGGEVRISSKLQGKAHVLSVQNSGKLKKEIKGESDTQNEHLGFGLSSSFNRLSILYGEKASLKLEQINMNTVQAEVIMPVI